MKNDFIAIILSLSFASSESNCELNDELVTEFELTDWNVQGVTNDPIFGVAIVGSDMGVGMTGFVVALMTSQSLHFFQVCRNWLLVPVWCTCIVKISDNSIYCHFLFPYVSDVIDCF